MSCKSSTIVYPRFVFICSPEERGHHLLQILIRTKHPTILQPLLVLSPFLWLEHDHIYQKDETVEVESILSNVAIYDHIAQLRLSIQSQRLLPIGSYPIIFRTEVETRSSFANYSCKSKIIKMETEPRI